MDGIGEQGLFIIAALVIAFINWLSGTLKKKQASRRSADEQVQAQHNEASEEPLSHTDHDSWPAPDNEPDLPLADSELEPRDPNREIREFFAALSGTPQVEVPPATVIGNIPEIAPTPVTAPPLSTEHVGPYTIADHDHDHDHDHPQAGNRKIQVHPIIRQFRKEGGARQAFIFSEILGKPKALRGSRN